MKFTAERAKDAKEEFLSEFKLFLLAPPASLAMKSSRKVRCAFYLAIRFVGIEGGKSKYRCEVA